MIVAMVLPPALDRTALEMAIVSARESPCQKSKRGAAVWRTDRYPGSRGRPPEDIVEICGYGFNGPPAPWTCDGACARKLESGQSVCSMICQHAEARAIRVSLGRGHVLDGAELVHIKVLEDGTPSAGGGPSCWQCSGAILDAGIAAVWLYEWVPDPARPGVTVGGALHKGMLDAGEGWPAAWKVYSAEEFHAITLAACGLTKGAS